MEDMNMAGKINADIQTKGSYKDVEDGRYDKLDTRGNLGINQFSFSSTDLPQGIKINQAKQILLLTELP
jgi:hypothetical protein